uniref:Uncharacterized protein n=1 Tax=Romanomermis culicivorax TaxID=13658 RepID=A0A915I074_ROMCU
MKTSTRSKRGKELNLQYAKFKATNQFLKIQSKMNFRRFKAIDEFPEQCEKNWEKDLPMKFSAEKNPEHYGRPQKGANYEKCIIKNIDEKNFGERTKNTTHYTHYF